MIHDHFFHNQFCYDLWYHLRPFLFPSTHVLLTRPTTHALELRTLCLRPLRRIPRSGLYCIPLLHFFYLLFMFGLVSLVFASVRLAKSDDSVWFWVRFAIQKDRIFHPFSILWCAQLLRPYWGIRGCQDFLVHPLFRGYLCFSCRRLIVLSNSSRQSSLLFFMKNLSLFPYWSTPYLSHLHRPWSNYFFYFYFFYYVFYFIFWGVDFSLYAVEKGLYYCWWKKRM